MRRAKYFVNGFECSIKKLHQERYSEQMSDYITSTEARSIGIHPQMLEKWRNSGKVRAKKVSSRWYYMRQDLIQILKEQ